MVRVYKLGSVVMGLAASGLAWGQAPLAPPPVAEPAAKVITVSEPGKPAQKCRVLKMWTQPNGGKACQVQAIDTGEMLTIAQTGPAVTDIAPGTQAKTMAMTIYHWNGNTPPIGTPIPPGSVQTPPAAPIPGPTVSMTPVVRTATSSDNPLPSTPIVQATQAAPMPTGPAAQSAKPTGTAQPGTAPMPTVVSGSATMQMPPLGADQRPPGPMTPGGIVLTPAPGMAGQEMAAPGMGIHEYPEGGTCGDGCTTCKPGLLQRIKGCFHKDCCPTTCCPDGCTSCTTQGAMPAPHGKGETAVPMPPPAEPIRGPKTTDASQSQGGLFNRLKSRTTDTAHAERPDPLKNPAEYTSLSGDPVGPPKTTAELAGSAAKTPYASPPQINMPVGGDLKKSPGASSVIAAGGDPQYVPVPMVTMPDIRRMPSPPPTQPPQPPQPIRGMMAGGAKGMSGPLPPTSEMTGNAFGPPPAIAGEMQSSAFHQGMPNAMGYGPAPAYATMPRPAMPYNGAAQPGSLYSVPPSQYVAPAGYQQHPGMMQPTAPPVPMWQQGQATPADLPSMLGQLHESMLPSEREIAASKLASLNWKANPVVVEALLRAAKEDPAGSVRAGCVRCLAQMNVSTPQVVAACNALKADTDPRVQHEVTEALAKLAPAQAPAKVDPSIQPASYVPPPPK
jgi:hypothetical protein